MKILGSQWIQAYPTKMYNLDSLANTEWKITNILTLISSVVEDIKYCEYEDGSVSFKTQTYNKNIKIEEIFSEEEE